MQALTFTQLVKLLLFVSSLALGQLLFKKVADGVTGNLLGEGFIGLLLNPWFWSAAMLYGISTLLWINILQGVPLSLAYPFVALAFVIVPLGAWAFFGEPLSLRYFLGVFLLCSGILVMYVGPGS